jgi:hypothetical protein
VIRFVLKLAVAGLLANAAWRVGSAYMSHYRFTDAVQETTHYRGERSDAQIHDRIFDLASQYDIPVDDDTLAITKDGNRTIVKGAYRKEIELVPGWIYDWPFRVDIDTPAIDPGTVDSPKR